MMAREEALALLRLEDSFTEQQLKKSYYILSKKYHPDVNKEPGAEEKFKKIGNAHELLKKELELKKDTSYQEVDLSSVKKEAIQEIFKKTYVDVDFFSETSPSNWQDYAYKLDEIFQEWEEKIQSYTSKEEIIEAKTRVEKLISNEMHSFGVKFFEENPHLNGDKNKTFKTVNEQLKFYKELIEKEKENAIKRIVSEVEYTIEYRLARNLLQLKKSLFDDFIIKKIQEENDLSQEGIRERAIQFLIKEIKEKYSDGDDVLHIIAFVKEAESVILLNRCLEVFLTKSCIKESLLNEIVKLSTERPLVEKKKRTLEFCRNIVFDKSFYLENIWHSMATFLAKMMHEKNFIRSKETNKYLNYMLEILELASNGIITTDTLRSVEDVVIHKDDEAEVLNELETALNITSAVTVNPDYLFIKLEDNVPNPFAVLHRGQINYELLFENELHLMQKMEIKNPTCEKIKGYLPIRTIFLNGEFIGKRLGDIEILYLYGGFYLTMDFQGTTTLYKKDSLNEKKFTEGVGLQSSDELLFIMNEEANEKYKNFVKEEKESKMKKEKK